jgi:hypothetical protein
MENILASSLQAAEEGLSNFLSKNWKGFTTLISHDQLIFEHYYNSYLFLQKNLVKNDPFWTSIKKTS